MSSLTYAVRWTECTGNGDIDHERLFDSQDQATAWLTDAESEDEYGYLPVIFEHCGPRVIVPLAQ